MQETRKRKTEGSEHRLGTNSAVDGLTCSEGQVEDLLAEGESTEAERKAPMRTSKQAVQRSPPAHEPADIAPWMDQSARSQ